MGSMSHPSFFYPIPALDDSVSIALLASVFSFPSSDPSNLFCHPPSQACSTPHLPNFCPPWAFSKVSPPRRAPCLLFPTFIARPRDNRFNASRGFLLLQRVGFVAVGPLSLYKDPLLLCFFKGMRLCLFSLFFFYLYLATSAES